MSVDTVSPRVVDAIGVGDGRLHSVKFAGYTWPAEIIEKAEATLRERHLPHTTTHAIRYLMGEMEKTESKSGREMTGHEPSNAIVDGVELSDHDVLVYRAIGLGETQAVAGFLREHLVALAEGRESPHTHLQALEWLTEIDERLANAADWNAERVEAVVA